MSSGQHGHRLEQLESRYLLSSLGESPEAFGGTQAGDVGPAVGATAEAWPEPWLASLDGSVDDHGNGFADACAVELTWLGERWFDGRIDYAGDVDMFRLVATRTGRMRVRHFALGPEGEPSCRLRVYDAEGNPLSEGTRLDASRTEVELTVLQGQSYHLSVEGQDGGGGLYRVHVLPTLGSEFTLARELAVLAAGSATVGERLEVSGASHMYKFTAPARGWFYIDMRACDELLDARLEVYDGDGRRLGFNDDASGDTRDSRFLLPVWAGQLYYVRAGGAGDSRGSYLLTLTGTASDDYSNSLAGASGVPLDELGAASISGRINYDRDVDVFQFAATVSGTMTVTMEGQGDPSGLVCGLSAFDSGGWLIAEYSGAAGEAPIDFDVLAGETYYLAVGSGDSTAGPYVIRIATADQSPPGPGEAIVAEVRMLSGQLQLYVLGTDQSDTIALIQAPGAMGMTTPAGTQWFQGSFDSLVVHGFGGADRIGVANSVAAATWICGGEGDDEVYDASGGAGVLDGQAGDDLLVSIGGGADQLLGGDGLDSFWSDAGDELADVSAAEDAALSVHVVAEFYQPYTTDPAGADYVPLAPAGQNFRDPEITSRASGYGSFISSPLFVDGPDYDDIAQGGVGDCYYLASLASIAETDPGWIRQCIAPLGDGTYAVRFFRDDKDVYLRIDADLPIIYSGQLAYAKPSAEGEIWVPLMEKAYAYFRRGQNSYASIQGGWMGSVYYELTNVQAGYMWPGGSTPDAVYDYMAAALASGHAVTLGSYSSTCTPIARSHAYVVKSIQETADGRSVTIYNPWGYDGRSWDSNPADGLLTISMNLFMANFSCIAECLV